MLMRTLFLQVINCKCKGEFNRNFFKVSVLGISEMWWCGSGGIIPAKGNVVIYSGNLSPLTATIRKVPNRDILLVTGDFSAKIGSGNKDKQ